MSSSLRISGILKCIAFTASEIFIVLKCNVFTSRFSLPVTATAENCILTIYPYMAIHLEKQNIILKNGKLRMTYLSLTLTVWVLGQCLEIKWI